MLKKKIKKIVSKLLPKGNAKEKIKLNYYRFFNKNSKVSFGLKSANGELVYTTKYNALELFTHEALYPIVQDFDYYQHFYKVKENDVVIDAGANNGHLSILFSKLIKDKGIVYAFEPDRFNIESINKNIKLNTDLPQNIKILDLLLWDKNELLDFYEAGTVGSSAVWIPDNEKVVKKQAVSIDNWVKENNITQLDFIKMDIEGAEIEALDGCVETIQKLKPNFAIASYHYVNGEQTYIKLERFFKEMGYPYKTVTFNKHEIITFAGPNLKTN